MRFASYLSFWTLSFALFFGMLLPGCSQNNENGPSSQTSGEIRSVISENERLQDQINRDQLLKASTTRDRKSIQKILLDIKIALIKLEAVPASPDITKILYRLLKDLASQPISQQDSDQFKNFRSSVSRVVAQSAKAGQLDIENLSWSVFSTNFSRGLEPFSTSAKGAAWKTDWALDETPYVTVNGFDNEAWLISPGFNLTTLKSPSFRFRHAVMINRNTGSGAKDDFSRQQIMAQAFKVMVSRDYNGGEPQTATWTRVDVGPMPNSYDFHTVDSAEVDLSAFVGDNVTIAFAFDMDARQLGRHYVTWQIYGFELYGNGDLQAASERPRILSEFKFSKEKLDPFQQLSIFDSGAKWEPFAIGGTIKYTKIQSNRKMSDNWLLSPTVRVQGQRELTLVIKEAVRNPKWDSLQIKVSSNYSGGDPAAAEWETLERKAKPVIKENQWKDLTSGPFDFKKYSGRDIVIAFRFLDNGEGGEIGWEIGSLAFIGIGDDLMTAGYSLNPPAPRPQPTPLPTPTPSATPAPTPTVLP